MADDLYQRDTLVLAHLRGYPEELRHYSNLIKQAHPRGMSALDFVLRRPAASDSSFATARRMDRRSFEKGTLAANYHTCPHCRTRETYRKTDYLIREELPHRS